MDQDKYNAHSQRGTQRSMFFGIMSTGCDLRISGSRVLNLLKNTLGQMSLVFHAASERKRKTSHSPTALAKLHCASI